jgi:hypothetical protein
MICEGGSMQISSASLLTAQQARTQTPVQPRAAQSQPAGADEFEPLLFAAKPGTSAPKATATVQPQARPAPFARPGSQLDIKI